ncbi:MAG: aminoacyl-tRNA hydrolase [Pseudomonadota bacterium]
MPVQLFVGLGNPGPKHARQRHNIGFMAVDAIAEREGAAPWRAKFQGETTEVRFGADKVILLKPTTFMNLSGQSVGEAARFFGIAPEEVTVFHDELDLAPGRLRVKRGGGHAGHNGLRSIHQHMGEAYRRVRLGIGHPGHKDRVAGYVLHDFSKAEEAWVAPLIDEVARAAGFLVAGDDPGFMNAVAARIAPPKPAREKKSAAQEPAAGPLPGADPTAREPARDNSPFEALKALLRRS